LEEPISSKSIGGASGYFYLGAATGASSSLSSSILFLPFDGYANIALLLFYYYGLLAAW